MSSVMPGASWPRLSLFARLPWRAEARRFLCSRLNLWVLGLFAPVLLAGACWSGHQARVIRLHIAAEVAAGTSAARTAHEQARVREAQQPFDAKRAANETYEYASRQSPPVVLPPLGGLVLATHSFARLDALQHVTLDSRHTDARRNEPIASPLLDQFGLPDFATLLALLLPLAAIGLTYGLVQEERERGTWRLVLAQPVSPTGLLAIALALRWIALTAVAITASAVAFALDSGASAGALIAWALLVAMYCAVWVAWCGVLCALPCSSTAAALAALGVWIATTFIAPAMLAWRVDRIQPMPSRLGAITQIRDAQQSAEVRMQELLARWYRAHPDRHPAAPATRDWPVSFMPRHAEQEALLRPIVSRFDEARATRSAVYQAGTWLAPGVVLLTAADRLAGSDPPRHAQYATAVNQFEDRWRGYFVPRIMSYRGVAASDFSRLPRFSAALPGSPLGWRPFLMLLTAMCLPLIALAVMRKGLSLPER